MASKQIKTKRSARNLPAQEVARKFWLAGLGAVSLAQKQGEKIVETLVDEGEEFRAKAEKLARTIVKDARRSAESIEKQVKGYVSPLRQRAVRAVREIETGFGDRIGDVLGRFGVPSKGDVEELISRVADLNKQVKGSGRKRAA
jgi:poly(hydroxyalkanoate) granule-associated protein